MLRQTVALRPFIGDLQASTADGQTGLPDPKPTWAARFVDRRWTGVQSPAPLSVDRTIFEKPCHDIASSDLLRDIKRRLP